MREERDPHPVRVSQERDNPVKLSESRGRVMLKRDGDLCREVDPGGTNWLMVIRGSTQHEQKVERDKNKKVSSRIILYKCCIEDGPTSEITVLLSAYIPLSCYLYKLIDYKYCTYDISLPDIEYVE